MPLSRHPRFNRSAGFTLVELLIVLTIVGILASVSMAIYRNSRVSAGEATAISTLHAINEAQFAFSQLCGSQRYAPNLASLTAPMPSTGQSFLSPDLGFDPLAKGYGPLFQYLDGLTTTVERVAAGQFTREAIAVVKNRQFIEFCEHARDRETAALYRDVIEPDERYHHELGRTLLLRLATTPAAQAAASSAARKTLELADELQKKALATAGIHHAPGC